MSVEAEAAAPTESNNEKEAACAEMFEKIVHYVEGELTSQFFSVARSSESLGAWCIHKLWGVRTRARDVFSPFN